MLCRTLEDVHVLALPRVVSAPLLSSDQREFAALLFADADKPSLGSPYRDRIGRLFGSEPKYCLTASLLSLQEYARRGGTRDGLRGVSVPSLRPHGDRCGEIAAVDDD